MEPNGYICGKRCGFLLHGLPNTRLKPEPINGDLVCCHRQMAKIRQPAVLRPLECLQLRPSRYGHRHALQAGATRGEASEGREDI